jgi:hypothetical protein
MEENLSMIRISVIFAGIVGIIITYASGFFRPLLPERTIDLLQRGSPFPYLQRGSHFLDPYSCRIGSDPLGHTPNIHWKPVADCSR